MRGSTKDLNKKNKKKNTKTVNVKMITKDPVVEKRDKKNRKVVFIALLSFVTVVFLLFLANKTFFRTEYNKNRLKIELPIFMYFISDKDNEVKLVTLRKSENLKEYYSEYLEGFTFYSCAEGETTFYYNEKTNTLIKEIKVEKNFALKTVSIIYDTRTPEEVCGLR